MRRLARIAVVALTMAAVPNVALGAGSWSWPVMGAAALPYGAVYANAAGASCTHGGLDIAAPAGTCVRSCAGGTVSFAGKVPAGEGQQAYAVTVSGADGLRVTYLPLRAVTVTKGQRVEAGAALGSLHAEGDASSASTHLHLGVRRGETQLDPAGFLAAPADAPESAGGPAPAPARAGNPAPAAPAVSGGAAAPAPTRAPQESPGQAAAHASGAPASQSAPSLSPGLRPAPADGAQLVREAARVAADAITGGPELARISPVADAPQLDAGRMFSDIAAGRGALGGLLLRLGLAVAGAACIVPVVRGARRAAGAQLPATLEPVRRATR